MEDKKIIGIEFGNTYLAPRLDHPRVELEEVVKSARMAYNLSNKKGYDFIGWMLIDDLHGSSGKMNKEMFVNHILKVLFYCPDCKYPDFYVWESELINGAKDLISNIPEVTSKDLGSGAGIIGRMKTKTGIKLYTPKFNGGYHKTKLEDGGVPTCPLLSATFHIGKLGGVYIPFHSLTIGKSPIAEVNLTILPSKYKRVEAEARLIMNVLAQVDPKYAKYVENTYHIFIEPNSCDDINKSLDGILEEMGV